jgi:hypothetical protein
LSASLMGQAAWAKGTKEPKVKLPKPHLKITEVFVDSVNEVITIVVKDLDFGPGPLEVRLGDETSVHFGDISDVCDEDLVSIPQTIECDFSATGLPPDGDYLLNVTTGEKKRQSDAYDLSIVAASSGGSGGYKQIIGHQMTCGPGAACGALAICTDSNQKVVGGGARYMAVDSGLVFAGSYPLNDTMWLHVARNDGTVDAAFQAYAICANVGP